VISHENDSNAHKQGKNEEKQTKATPGKKGAKVTWTKAKMEDKRKRKEE
jgi:hypothetical protein